MALEVVKKEKENPQNLAHRFTKMVRRSGLLLELRRRQFQKKPKSALAKKRSALRKVVLIKEKKRQERLAKPS